MFRIWTDADYARKVVDLENGRLLPKAETAAPAPPQPAPVRKEPRRSDAIGLLALLQREARFVDFIQEPIGGYSDAQIGAAVRDVHKNCATALERAFAIQPLSATAEGGGMEVPRNFDPVQFRLTGNVSGEPPYKGTVRHPGWKATKCELPAWSGGDSSAMVIAATEIEIK